MDSLEYFICHRKNKNNNTECILSYEIVFLNILYINNEIKKNCWEKSKLSFHF